MLQDNFIPVIKLIMHIVITFGILQLLYIIIQQIVTLSKYGHDALDICHP